MDGVLDTVREFLEQRLLPSLEGDEAYQARVCIILLRMVQRELAQGPALDAAEAGRLRALLGSAAPPAELKRQLAAAIRSGELDWQREDLLEHLRQTARDKLLVVSPGYLEG